MEYSREVSKYTVVELRQLLRDAQLPTSGNKADLIQRLTTHIIHEPTFGGRDQQVEAQHHTDTEVNLIAFDNVTEGEHRAQMSAQVSL